MLLTVDRTFSDQVEAMLIHDFELAREITSEDSQDTHRLQQLGMRIARLISPIL
jgi:cardiolipin synthase